MTLRITNNAAIFKFAILLLCLSSVAASAQGNGETTQSDIVEADIRSGAASEADPYENWNRKVYDFNVFIDDWFLKPVAQGYRAVMPSVADRAVTNFFNNIGEIGNFANSIFQLKGEAAVVAVGRFTYNTVFGLGGLFDVATVFELPERPEDFGQTLGYWGMGSGPYLMLPLMGPSTGRDFTGFVVDVTALPGLSTAVDEPDYYYLVGVQVVDRRADLIPAERFISGDPYTFVRNAYLQRRAYLINDGQPSSDPFASGENNEDLMLEDF